MLTPSSWDDLTLSRLNNTDVTAVGAIVTSSSSSLRSPGPSMTAVHGLRSGSVYLSSLNTDLVFTGSFRCLNFRTLLLDTLIH